MSIEIKSKKLKGTVNIPPSKSLSHRAIIAASLSEGESIIENIILSDDIKATINAMKSFGVEIEEIKGERYKLIINGKNKLKLNNNIVDCSESGSTLRFLIPFFTLLNDEVVFIGKNKLIERPLDPYYKIFDKQKINYENNLGNLPLKISGELKAGKYEIDGDISSQFITGLMYVLPLLNDDSEIIINKKLESKSYVDLTIDVLKKFNIEIENENNEYRKFKIKGNQKYTKRNYKVEGDYSQAAFWITASLIGNDVLIKGLDENSIQGDIAILKIIEDMGAKYEFKNDILIIKNENILKNIEIDVNDCPDLVPILVVLASFSKGKCKIINAKRLRLKESDRLKAISSEINKLGGNIIEFDDGLEVYPINKGIKSEVKSFNDHRIAMALSIFSTRVNGNIILNGETAINKSYPDFYKDFIKLGGEINV
ncbi:3-phosphoshikimate 1-carboxyvinyltransferase [Clostridiaceae bacterium HSG29]|nr:3-phosphoshikimate 1-carboxyvinyltransferase [Clostridiaceae bacterium HSG29]